MQMTCDECGNDNASINLIDMVGGQKTERLLCQNCYDASGVADPFSQNDVQKNDWMEALNELDVPPMTPEEIRTELLSEVRCNECNYSLTEFQKNGRVRCAEDYEAFAPNIESLLKNLHGAAVHTGSVPRRIKDQMARSHRIRQLENELGIAVHEEDYEAAAALRDRICSLRLGGDHQEDE